MRFTPLQIPEVVLIEPRVIIDDRGLFMEVYREDIFAAHGIATRFVQDNCSVSRRGVLRGLHFQVEPAVQAKLVRVIRGEVYDVAVDLRRNSRSFGRHVGVILNAENRRMLFIPEGFAHGFLAMADDTEISYKCSRTYSAAHERGILWSDRDLDIQWPEIPGGYILSSKDNAYPPLKDLIYD